jgi:hypothetical protein
MNKPREFWIFPEDDDRTNVFESPSSADFTHWQAFNFKPLHVVEYFAYEQACLECQALEEELFNLKKELERLKC